MLSKSVKFFPFSPGIPWKLKNGKYVQPEVPSNHLSNLINEKSLVVLSFGGIVEAVFSLFFIETLKTLKPKQDIYWVGNKKFSPLVQAQGLGHYSDLVNENTLKRFTTPVFFDKEDRAYFNSLYNYLDVYSYYLDFGYENKKPGFKQILNNLCYGSDFWEVPKARNIEVSSDLHFHLNSAKIDLSLPFVLIMPDETGDSLHQQSCLNWSPREINSLAAMLYSLKIQTVVLTPRVGKYFGGQAKCVPYNFDFALTFLSKASVILSKELDFLYLSRILFSNMSFSLPISGLWSWKKNHQVFKEENGIYIEEEISPHLVFNYIKDRR